MSILTSDDDLSAPLFSSRGRFTKHSFGSDQESAPTTLADPNHDIEDLNDTVVICGCPIRNSVKREVIVIVLMLAVILTGAGNSVTSRIKGQALGHFNFFASLGNAVVFVVFLCLHVSL